MKNKVTRLMILSLLSLGAVGCSGGNGNSSSGGELHPSGDEPWLGNWERPDMPSEPEEELHFCEHACYECGKCLVDCEDEVCKEKCYELGNRQQYVFNATDRRVEKLGGVNIEGDHIGNINQNPNVQIIYHIQSEKETTVCIGATISEMNESHYVTSDTPIFINDTPFYSRGYLKAGGTTWTNFFTVWLGCVQLQAGENVIKLTNPHADGQQYNFKDFTFLSPSELSWYDASNMHPCESQNAEGKCTNYDCNEWNCLDKDETGWNSLTIQGGDEKVLKYYYDASGQEKTLWNEGEQCIGNIANSLITKIYKQTIIWAFEASEETYVRLTLNTSTTSGGTPFEDVFDMTMNGEAIHTKGALATVESGAGWMTYVDSKVAYVKVQPGVSTFMLVHKDTNAGDNIKHLNISYQKGTITAAQAQKPNS